MAEITAKLVKELRENLVLVLWTLKKALVEVDDIEKRLNCFAKRYVKQ